MKTHPDISIRQTTAADYATVYDLIQTAFLTAEHRDGDEQDFAERLRNSPAYLPGLDLLAEVDGQPAGHIMLTRTRVVRPDGSHYDTLLVAPLSVLLEYRNLGVGSALMQQGLRLAAEMGYGAAFLVGDPNYYRRFGYELSAQHGIVHESLPAEYVMVKELRPGALSGITGKIEM